MKKVLTVIISAIAFGLIAGLVMVGVNVFSLQTGLLKNNAVVDIIENVNNKKSEEIVASVSSTAKKEIKEFIRNNTYYDELLPDLIEEVMPTVVSITNMQKFKQNGYSMFGFRVQPQEYEAPASGSGVIVGMTNEQVIILTNNHVITDSSSLSVRFHDNTEDVDASIKGTDASKDLAIISVNKKNIKKEILDNIKISRIGNSDNVKIGEGVVAIGNALGIGQSVTCGIISAKDRVIDGIENSAKLIQIDAPINPGNSGGALINMKGELIGINVAKSSGNAIEGVGYAIPINVAAEVIETMSKRKDREEIPEEEQGELGISVARNVDLHTMETLGLPEGVFVKEILDDSAAKNSGLKEKDIIVSFDDQSVKTVDDLIELLKYTRAGQEITIKVKRQVEDKYVDKEFTIKLGKKKIDKKSVENEKNVPKESKKGNEGNNRQEPQPRQEIDPNSGGFYYDPFADIDDILRNFGGFGW